jgi:hypothetical protein
MQHSGVSQVGDVDMDFEDDSDSKVHVLIHDLKPPFLDGTIAYTKQLDPINPVRDVTSDLAIFSKKGSTLVRERRERQEREKVSQLSNPYAPQGRQLDFMRGHQADTSGCRESCFGRRHYAW